MHCLPPVETQHERNVVVVEPIDRAVVQQHAVRRQCEFELFVRLRFSRADIFRHGFDCLEIDQRLAAEEIDLAMSTHPRVLDDKIDRRASDFRAHHSARAVRAAVAKTIFASKIAILRDHQTQRFDNAELIECRRHVDLRREKQLRFDQFMQLAECFIQIGGGIFLIECGDHFRVVRAVETIHDVENQFVDDVHRPAVDVEQNVFAALPEFMNALVD